MYACDEHPENHSKFPGDCAQCDKKDQMNDQRARAAAKEARRLEEERKKYQWLQDPVKEQKKLALQLKKSMKLGDAALKESHRKQRLYGKRPRE